MDTNHDTIYNNHLMSSCVRNICTKKLSESDNSF